MSAFVKKKNFCKEGPKKGETRGRKRGGGRSLTKRTKKRGIHFFKKVIFHISQRAQKNLFKLSSPPPSFFVALLSKTVLQNVKKNKRKNKRRVNKVKNGNEKQQNISKYLNLKN